jgi:hypothetical protein
LACRGASPSRLPTRPSTDCVCIRLSWRPIPMVMLPGTAIGLVIVG